MFRGYNLAIPAASGRAFVQYRSPGRSARTPQHELQHLADQLTRQQIEGDAIKEAWFQGLKADVFLSHAHANEELALDVADYLNAKFNLNAFVDSRVWGEANMLLRTIDKTHCRSDDGKYYDYDKRNYSTSHVHMILATALTEMIDRCECVFFLNTPTSIQARDAEGLDEDRTASPWIYHEFMMAKLIRRHPDRPSVGLAESAALEARLDARDRTLEISYEAPLAHLGTITMADLLGWAQQSSLKSTRALDWFYRKHPAPPEEARLLRRSL